MIRTYVLLINVKSLERSLTLLLIAMMKMLALKIVVANLLELANMNLLIAMMIMLVLQILAVLLLVASIPQLFVLISHATMKIVIKKMDVNMCLLFAMIMNFVPLTTVMSKPTVVYLPISTVAIVTHVLMITVAKVSAIIIL
jgi:hypothetical protein